MSTNLFLLKHPHFYLLSIASPYSSLYILFLSHYIDQHVYQVNRTYCWSGIVVIFRRFRSIEIVPFDQCTMKYLCHLTTIYSAITLYMRNAMRLLFMIINIIILARSLLNHRRVFCVILIIAWVESYVSVAPILTTSSGYMRTCV